jgi:hypothetical protein
MLNRQIFVIARYRQCRVPTHDHLEGGSTTVFVREVCGLNPETTCPANNSNNLYCINKQRTVASLPWAAVQYFDDAFF